MSPHEFVPSWFAVAISPRRNGSDGDHIIAEFANVVRTEPSRTIVTDSFSVLLATSCSTQVAVDPTEQVVLVLHGEIYNHQSEGQAEFLLREYMRQPATFAQHLDGELALLIIDKRIPSVVVITDQVNSRMVFHSRYKGSTWVSTSLDVHPTVDVRPDVMGVAWYLVTSSIRNGRTLFDGVKVLENASVHSFAEGDVSSTRYWSPPPAGSYSNASEKDLRADLADLLVESLEKRLSSLQPRRVFVPLSGGIDSSAILGVLRYKLNVEHLQCYSYGLYDGPPGSDSYVARQMAAEAGVDLKVFESYKGDLPRQIESTARLSHGMSDIYLLDTVSKMAADFTSVQPSVMFIGDGRFDQQLPRSMNDAMRGLQFFRKLRWLRPIVSSELFRTLRDGLEEERSVLMSRCPDANDYLQVRRFLRDESSGRWAACRQLFHGKYATFSNPWSDNALGDFMAKVPPHLKRKKVLYRATVEGLFPQIFKFDRSRYRGVVPDWGTQIELHRSSLEELTLSRSTRIDDLIPPEVVKRLLRENVPAQPAKNSNGTRLWESSITLLGKAPLGAKVARVASRRRRARARSRENDRLDRNGFLIRLLIIRSVLARN